MVYVQTTFDLDDIGYSATLPTYRTVLRREHRLSESEDEHLRRCRACSEARPMIDWTIGTPRRPGERSSWSTTPWPTSWGGREATGDARTHAVSRGRRRAELHGAEPA